MANTTLSPEDCIEIDVIDELFSEISSHLTAIRVKDSETSALISENIEISMRLERELYKAQLFG